jgi:hypothetical protein
MCNKCLYNNNGANSTVKPTGTLTVPFITNDNYIWKYKFSLDLSDINDFLTETYLPVKTLLTDDTSEQWDVQQTAANGAIHINSSN